MLFEVYAVYAREKTRRGKDRKHYVRAFVVSAATKEQAIGRACEGISTPAEEFIAIPVEGDVVTQASTMMTPEQIASLKVAT